MTLIKSSLGLISAKYPAKAEQTKKGNMKQVSKEKIAISGAIAPLKP